MGIDSNNITVGGTVSGAGNVISGNGEGMFIGTTTASVSNIVVQGNLIGTQIDGKSPLGNTGAGIEVLEGGFLAVPIQMSRSAPQSIPARPPTRLEPRRIRSLSTGPGSRALRSRSVSLTSPTRSMGTRGSASISSLMA